MIVGIYSGEIAMALNLGIMWVGSCIVTIEDKFLFHPTCCVG